MNVTHALQILITGVSKAAPALLGVAKKLSALSKIGDLVKKSFVGASVATAGFVASIAGVATAVAGFVVAAIPVTATLESMRDAMWGIAGEAAPAMLESLRRATSYMVKEVPLLRQYNQAYMLLGKTLAERLPEALKYLTKVSLATGDETTYLMERLTKSVGRLSTRWMAYIGTVVTLEEATSWAVQTTGKFADELTREEIQAAMMDRVLLKLEARTAALPEPIGNVVQLLSQLGAEFVMLRTDLARHFLPVARSFLLSLINLVKWVQKLSREGGALYIPLRKLAAIFTVLVELVAKWHDKALLATDDVADRLGSFADNLITMAGRAFEWGFNIVAELAIGITKGASVVLVGAMNFVAGLLEWWLAPGSAPRIVSNILDWGASAFTEYLRGFTLADFDVLEGVQRPLKRALGILVKLDLLSPVKAAEVYIGLSEKMAAALEHFSETGEVLDDVFSTLASQVSGGYGKSLAILWQRQLGLAVAVERLAKAELRLKTAREGEEEANTRLSKAAREYNKLVRAGADPAILQAKLKSVKADYASLEAARKETGEAEKAEELAAEEAKRQKDRVKLQERLLNQLVLMGQAMVDLETARRKEAEAAREFPTFEWPELHPPKIDQAFEDLKNSILAQFTELWASVKQKWDDSGVLESVGKLRTAWESLSPVLEAVHDKLGKAVEALTAWTKDRAWPWILNQWDKWDKWWERKGPKIEQGILGIYTSLKDWQIDNIWSWVLIEWDKWVVWWKRDGPAITEAVEKIKKAFEDLRLALTGEKGEGGFWGDMWSKIVKITEWELRIVQSVISLGMELIRSTISIAGHLITGDWEGFYEDMRRICDSFFNVFNTITGGKLGEWIEVFQRAFIEILADAWQFGKDLIEKLKHSLGFRSPSKYFIEMGENMVRSISTGIQNIAKSPINLMAGTFTGAALGVGASKVKPSIIVNNYFGVDSVRSKQDIYKLAEQIQRGLTLRGVRDTLQ